MLKHVGVNKGLRVNCYLFVCRSWILTNVKFNRYVHGRNNTKDLKIVLTEIVWEHVG
jgi:hypothetical protein